MFRPRSAEFLKFVLSGFLEEKSILIIDDEEEVRILMANYFIRSKVEEEKIIFATNGLDALSKIEAGKIGLIIVDIIMPEMNGIDFIQEIKDTDEYKNIPIIISSGNVNSEHVRKALIHGIKGILVKPFNYDRFMDRVTKAICN